MFKKKNEDENKLKKPTEVSVEIGYTSESKVQNASKMNYYRNFRLPDSISSITFADENSSMTISDLDVEYVYNDESQYLNLFDIEIIKDRIANGSPISEICNDMRQWIMKNKDTNPDAVQRAVSNILGCAENYYDNGTDNILRQSGYTRKHQGDTTEEILTKIVNVPLGEELNGFVCSTISEFGMRLLDECGIKSAMLCGGTDSSNHTVLLWQRSDGKYVLSNYGNSYIIEASSIKDAAREVYKEDAGLINNGYIYFVDNKGSYQEFAMKEEAVWGNELDKRDYNNESVFNHLVAKKPSINASVNCTTLGSKSADVTGTIVYGNDTKLKETSFSVGFKNSLSTSLADKSTGIGVKLVLNGETKTSNGKKFFSTKIIADYTKLHTNEFKTKEHEYNPFKSIIIKNEELLKQIEAANNDTDINVEGDLTKKLFDIQSVLNQRHAIDNSSHATVFVREVLCKERTLLKDGNVELTNAAQLSGLLGFNFVTSSTISFGGDIRVTGEEGLKLDIKNKNSLFSNNISGGIIADLSLKSGTLTASVSPGVKLNAGSLYKTNLDNQTTLSASVDGYTAVTRTSSDYGVSGGVQVTYRPSSRDITIFGGVNAGVERQRLRIGGFNEQTENTAVFGAAIGAQIGNRANIRANFNAINDKLNSTRNKQTFSITAGINL